MPEITIVHHLLRSYCPDSIILHGSRANGMARAHSDWDIIMLFAKRDVPRSNFRETISSAIVEWRAYKTPVHQKDIISTFNVYLQFSQLLFDKDNIGASIIDLARAAYAKGPCLTSEEVTRSKLYLHYKITSLIKDRQTDYLARRHINDLSAGAIKSWLEIKHNKFSLPVYYSVPLIRDVDPQYHSYIAILTSCNVEDAEKIMAAQQIFFHLFNEQYAPVH